MLNYPLIRQYLRTLGIIAAIVIAVLWVVTPFIISSIYAFSSSKQYYSFKIIVPINYTLTHVEMLLSLGAGQAIMNSIIVASLTVLISFILGLPAGYAFARYLFRGKDSLKLLIVGLRMFPIMVIAVPLVALYMRLNLNDTLIGVALAHTSMALPFVVLITSSIFAGIPKELEEAAMVFGLDRKGAFLHITMPLSLPGLAAAGIFAFLISWNEVFIASVLTLTNRTLTAFMLTSAMAATDFMKFAGAFMIVFPALIFVFIARKYLIAMWGITLR